MYGRTELSDINLFLFVVDLIASSMMLPCVIKMALNYKKNKNSLTILLLVFFVYVGCLYIYEAHLTYYELQLVPLGFMTGQQIENILTLMLTAYLLTISVYLLEAREFYIIPFSTAIEVILFSFVVPTEVMTVLRLPILTVYTIPSAALFLYFSIKNRDGKSLAFFLLLVILAVSNVFLTINPVVTAILILIAQINLLVGIFGLHDYFLKQKEEKKQPTWIEQVV